jgi:hypothetical protein
MVKAALRAQGDERVILFEEPELSVTGVPRSDEFGKWQYEHFEPDPLAIARRLLRAKWDKHGAFSTAFAIPVAVFTEPYANRVHRCRQSCRLYHSKGADWLRGKE